ncbi:MAG TPA: chorismate synthase [Planctomycetota bacterium]|nr:chorismate synthase [Planctomycetota bacterium]
MSRLTWRTAGESHGRGLVAILEGFPAGFELDLARIDRDLARRQGGYGRGGRMKIERDHAELISGLRAGRTLGSPIAILIENKDQTIERLPVPTNPRPGHADLAGCQKLGARDPRAVLERASARETAARVALAAIARQLIEAFGVEVFAHVVELGGRATSADAWSEARDRRVELREASEFFSLDPAIEPAWRKLVDEAREAGDSLGGVFEVRARGVIPGLGSYNSGAERLTARLGAALFSIPAIKGVEFGLGFESARRPGSQVHDAIVPASPGATFGRFARSSNRAGGLEGGMTTGEDLVVRAAMKPIPTLRMGMDTVDFETGAPTRATYQRSDVTSVPAASVVGEAMVALELADAFLAKFAGDTLGELRDAYQAYQKRLTEL